MISMRPLRTSDIIASKASRLNFAPLVFSRRNPGPEITRGKLKNLLTSGEIALKDGNVSVKVPASTALFIGR
jgi:hypothetical protein